MRPATVCEFVASFVSLNRVYVCVCAPRRSLIKDSVRHTAPKVIHQYIHTRAIKKIGPFRALMTSYLLFAPPQRPIHRVSDRSAGQPAQRCSRRLRGSVGCLCGRNVRNSPALLYWTSLNEGHRCSAGPPPSRPDDLARSEASLCIYIVFAPHSHLYSCSSSAQSLIGADRLCFLMLIFTYTHTHNSHQSLRTHNVFRSGSTALPPARTLTSTRYPPACRSHTHTQRHTRSIHTDVRQMQRSQLTHTTNTHTRTDNTPQHIHISTRMAGRSGP